MPLEVHIAGFPGKHYCPRMATMNKPTYRAIITHSPDKPSLVFVSSRRQTRLTALDLIAYCVRQLLCIPTHFWAVVSLCLPFSLLAARCSLLAARCSLLAARCSRCSLLSLLAALAALLPLPLAAARCRSPW